MGRKTVKKPTEINPFMTLSPANAARMFNIDPRNFALWRSRGYLSGYGVPFGDTGKALFTWADLAGVAVGSLLMSFYPIEAAFSEARSLSNNVLDWAQAVVGGKKPSSPRFRVYHYDREQSGSSEPVENMADLTEMLERGDFEGMALVVDFKKLAEGLPSHMKSLSMQIVPE